MTIALIVARELIGVKTMKNNGQLYAYGMRLRGISIGTQPRDFIRYEDQDHDHGAKYYSIVYYNRRLTPEEIKAYDLDSLTPETKEEIEYRTTYKYKVQRALDRVIELACENDYFDCDIYDDDMACVDLIEGIVKEYIKSIKEEEHN